MAHLPTLEPSDAQECYDFTKLAFEISDKFKIPVMVRTTIRVAHQRAPVEFEPASAKATAGKGSFVKNVHQYVTLPPRVLEMKKELLEKTEKIRAYLEKSNINTVWGKAVGQKIGVIASGVGFDHLMEAQKEMGIALPVLKIGSFYPLPEKKISDFINKLNKVLIVEELDPYVEKEVERLAKSANPKIKIFGKDLLPEVGELNPDQIAFALAKMTGKKYTPLKAKDLKIPRRVPKLCDGCPYWYVFPVLKRIAPPNTVFGGDIGCNMIAGYPPHNMQDYEFCMGSSIGIAHGVKKAVQDKQKVIATMGDGTFFHSGISGLINAVYNKSNPLFIILDNRITAMTGHQNNPGMGKNGMGDPAPELLIEDIAKACGVKNIKVLDQINMKEFEETIKDFLDKKEISVIICKRICALLERRQKNG
jgi:indolepyruvate ferredoxin oxidoreductase alpha subunit